MDIDIIHHTAKEQTNKPKLEDMKPKAKDSF